MLYRVELYSIYGDTADFLIKAASKAHALELANRYSNEKLSDWLLDDCESIKEVKLPGEPGVIEMNLNIHDDPGECTHDSVEGWQ